MASKRLPGKVLMDIAGTPLLRRLCNRMRLCRRADEVVIATSDQPQDRAIADACAAWGFHVFRGPEQDLTSRLLGAARAHDLTFFVRVTADNPLTDPQGIDALIDALQKRCANMKKSVLVHNMHAKGYPYGTGAEAAHRGVLEICDRDLTRSCDREYFALYVKTHPEQFDCVKIDAPPQLVRPGYFLTVDHPVDLELMRAIYAGVPGEDEICLQEVIRFLDANPELAKRNSNLHQEFAA